MSDGEVGTEVGAKEGVGTTPSGSGLSSSMEPQGVSTLRASIPSADVSANGPVNGLGEPDPAGSYILFAVDGPEQVQRFKISAGTAEVLAAELLGSLDRRSLRTRIETTTGDLVLETDAQISCALRWYRRQSSRHALMARIDELEAQAIEARVRLEASIRSEAAMAVQLVSAKAGA